MPSIREEELRPQLGALSCRGATSIAHEKDLEPNKLGQHKDVCGRGMKWGISTPALSQHRELDPTNAVLPGPEWYPIKATHKGYPQKTTHTHTHAHGAARHSQRGTAPHGAARHRTRARTHARKRARMQALPRASATTRKRYHAQAHTHWDMIGCLKGAVAFLFFEPWGNRFEPPRIRLENLGSFSAHALGGPRGLSRETAEAWRGPHLGPPRRSLSELSDASPRRSGGSGRK